MPYADLGQYKYHYLDYPNDGKEILCLVHAFTLDHRMWLKEAERFAKDYRVIVPDLKGHGLSDAPESGYSRKDRVEDFVRFLDALKIDKVHYVGLSYGGTTGLGVALSYPERLRSLALVASSAAGYDMGPKISKIDQIAREQGVDTAKQRWISSSTRWYRDDQSELKQFVTQMMTEHSGAIWADPMRGKYEREYDLDRLGEIDLPTLVMAGEMDKIFVPLAERFAGEIKGARLKIFDRIGHLVNLENHNGFCEELERFLSNL